MNPKLGLFVVYRKGQRAVVTKTDRRPGRCRYAQRLYELEGHLGDFNHLLNARNELVGFDFPYADLFCGDISTSRLVKETTNSRVVNGGVQFVFTDDKELRNDGSQAIGNWVYADRQGDHIVVIGEVTEWGKLWDRIGFEISDDQLVEFED